MPFPAREMPFFTSSDSAAGRPRAGANPRARRGSAHRATLSWAPRLLRVAGLACALATLALPARAVLPIQHWVQPSGARVYFIQSPAIPMVDVQVDFDAGQRRDPDDKAGLASMVAANLDNGLLPRQPSRAGGRSAAPYDEAMDENALGEAWADLGASFGVSAGDERMSVSLRSLTEPDLLARAVTLAARQLGEPAFPAGPWERDRARTIASLRESYTRPATAAARAWYPAVYGGHPYGRMATEATLSRLTLEDLRDFHARYLQACRARVTLVGALTREQADRVAADLLARLPASADGRCDRLPEIPEVRPLAAPVTQEVPFDSAQAHVLIGQPGIRRSDPDFFAILVGNYTLGGGGFVSRLSTEVREKRGLSYSVYSSFAPGLQVGSFSLGLQTRPDQARQAVQVAREVVARFVAEGPTEAELQAAKDNLIGGFALRIDTNRKLVDNVASIAWNDLPLDYLATWPREVAAVTREQVRAAFARVLQPDRMVTVLVGAPPAPAPAR